MTASKTSEEEAREFAESIINTVREPLIILDHDLEVVIASRSFYDTFKVSPEETEGQPIYDLGNKQWDIPGLRQLLETVLPQKTTLTDYEVEHEFAGLSRRTLLLNAREIQRKPGKERLIILAIEDITERKSREYERRELIAQLLALINSPGDFREIISPLLDSLQSWSGAEAVGLRMLDGEDFPYYETRGFPPEFIEEEKHLCAYGPDGKILRNGRGNPVLECMCGNVLSGSCDPSKPFFTNHGSFWIHSTSALLASTTEADRQARTRNRCHGEGYESVALIPLRTGEQVLGLLQFNDPRPGRFTREQIDYFESVADSMAAGLALRQAEETLRQSENYYRAIFETSGSAMFIIEEDTTISHVNSNFEAIVGYSKEMVKGKKSWTELVHPGDVEWMKENHYLRRRDPRAAPLNYEFRFFVRNGELRNGYLTVDIIPGTSQSVVSLIDITKRKQAEEAIENERTYLSAVIDNIGEAIVICDAEGRLTRFNETARRLHGLPEEPVPSDQWARHYDLYQEDGITPLPMEDIPLFRALQGEHVLKAEIVVAPKHSRPYSLVCNGQALTDETDKIIGAVVAMHDITERKAMEKALRRERNFKQRYLDTTQTIMVALDAEGRVTMINRSGCELLGYAEDEILGCNWFETCLPQPEGMDNVFPVFQRIMSGDLSSAEYFENSVVCRDGTQRLIGWHNAFLEDDDGRVVGTLTSGEDITERKQAEKALRESEERFKQWFESSPISLWEQDFSAIKKRIDEIMTRNVGDLDSYFRRRPDLVWELAGMVRVLDVNQATVELYRAKSKEAFFGGITKVFSKESLGEFLQVLKVIAAGEKTYVTEKEHVTLDGEPLKVQLYWTVAKGHEETYSRILLSIVDITQRKQAEEALRQSENYYRALFETSGTAMFIIEEDTIISEVNTNFETLSGYCKQEVEGEKSWIEFIHADDVGWMKQYHYLRRRNPEAAPRQYEFRFITRHGEKRNILLAVDMIAGTNRNIASCIDITERKQAEEEVAASEEKYRSILDSIEDGYFEVDLAGNFTFFNDSMCRILGYPSAELTGMNNREYMDKNNAEKVFQAFNQVFTTGESLKTFDWELIRKDGEKCYVDTSISLMKNTNGKAIGFRGVARDITARKKAEAEREKLQAQLNQAQKMESVGRLAGGVAHDFNNMLTIINGYAEMMAEVLPSSDPMHDNACEIHDAGKRAAVVVRKLLAFARKQTISPVSINLNDSISSMLKMLQRLIGENIDLLWKPGNNTWPIKMDSSQIDQILANLVVNARDAIPDVGKITIHTKNIEFDEQYCSDHTGFVPGQFVMLAVSDNGCGMDKHVLDNLFEPFYTTKEVGQGTGLGMPTVYGIVKQNNGFVNVYSEPGQGTTVKIYFPRFLEGADISDKKQEKKALPKGRGETILVLEDETVVMNITRIMLERLGYNVITASRPGEAMEAAKANNGKIDLLLSDIIMPEMNGREFAEQLNDLYPDIKTLFMSGYTENVIAHHTVLDDGLHFIEKPFSNHKLAAKVREVLD